MNTLNIIGGLTRDPELSFTKNQKPFTKFSIGFQTGWGDNKKSNYLDCVVWGKQAEVLSQYFRKGSRIGLTGEINQEQWESNGQKRSKIVLVVRDFDFIDKKSDNQQQSNSQPQFNDMPADFVSNDDEVPF